MTIGGSQHHQKDRKVWYRPYAYDVIISLRPHLGDIGLCINAVVRKVPAADHKGVQCIGFCPQHGGMMTSMHKVYSLTDTGPPLLLEDVPFRAVTGETAYLILTCCLSTDSWV